MPDPDVSADEIVEASRPPSINLRRSVRTYVRSEFEYASKRPTGSDVPGCCTGTNISTGDIHPEVCGR